MSVVREPFELDPTPLWDWINERHAIYLRKALRDGDAIPAWASTYAHPPAIESGLVPGLLTLDEELGEYRFCNVFRELDRVTVWVREEIREPFADHKHLWMMLAIARTFNWPPTLRELIDEGRWPSEPDFSPADLTEGVEERSERGEKVETGAYMVRAESDRAREWYSWSKARYLCEIVLGNLWLHRADLLHDIESAYTLREVWERLVGFYAWGPFIAYEVVTDLRHTRYGRNAEDINTWANPGPGALRGLNRLAGRPLKPAPRRDVAIELMVDLLARSREPGALAPWVPPLELRDIEHSLCETDKWLRAKSGEGRPRSRYVPGRGW